jgi:hypothetical protein
VTINAFTDLQDALNAASSGNEIWVAAETYTPGALRTDCFQLKSGVAVYGGFNGTETVRSQRNWATNVTILSGDIGTVGTYTDNSYNVVVGAAGATLDGFTITKGYADHASIAQYQCGSGMYNSNCSPTVANCAFKDNHADYGGGMSNTGSSPTVIDCSFTDNEAVYWGGAMENYSSSSPTVTRCIFADNAVTATGYGGGAIFCYSSSNANIVNCTISKNTAANSYAGGLYSYSSSPTIINTIFWDNTDGYSGYDLAAVVSGTITRNYCDVVLSYYYSGSGSATGSGNINADPLFANAANNDFHLKSAGGRWNGSAWVKDNAVSPCINTGDPSSSYSNEPTPNGSRINMGVYGNTSEASKTGYGSLCVTLYPATAKWRLVGGDGIWRGSGYTLNNIKAYGDTYPYGIEFKELPGYKTPSIVSTHVYPEITTYVYKTYDPL